VLSNQPESGSAAQPAGAEQSGTHVQAASLTQIEEVKSCNGYYSASDLRIHFGLNEARRIDLVEIRWPSGIVDALKDLDTNHLYVIEEGGKILKKDPLAANTR